MRKRERGENGRNRGIYWKQNKYNGRHTQRILEKREKRGVEKEVIQENERGRERDCIYNRFERESKKEKEENESFNIKGQEREREGGKKRVTRERRWERKIKRCGLLSVGST